MAGEVLFYPRVMMLSEKQKIEGYLAENETYKQVYPAGTYKSSKLLGSQDWLLTAFLKRQDRIL